jgi:hypothetical protein
VRPDLRYGTQLWDALRLLVVTLWEPLLFLAGLATALATRRRWWRRHLLLAVPVGTGLPSLFLHFEARYLLPASFVWMVLATLGADLALERWSEARGPATGRAPVARLRAPSRLLSRATGGWRLRAPARSSRSPRPPARRSAPG